MKTLLERAQDFATACHEQQRFADRPYTYHLAKVEAILRRFGCGADDDLLAAGWLHDTMEDCGVTAEQLLILFNSRICQVVQAVTDEPGINRAERHALTYPKILNFPDARLVKLADRIANVEAGLELRSRSKVRMYLKEARDFETGIRPGVPGRWQGGQRRGPGMAEAPAETDMWTYLKFLLTVAIRREKLSPGDQP